MSSTLIANAALLKTRIPKLLGSLTALNAPLQFGIPDVTNVYRGQRVIVASAAGAVTTPTWVLECSIDQGLSWFLISPAIVLTASTPTYGLPYALSGQVTGDNAPVYAARYDVSGLSGSTLKFGLTAGTGITALPIFALVG
jgi:hypothetical protein